MGYYIYFVQNQYGLVKIGYSRDPEKRIAFMQNATGFVLTVLAIVPGDHNDEKELHRRFNNSQAQGEWFYPTKDIMSYIEGVK